MAKVAPRVCTTSHTSRAPANFGGHRVTMSKAPKPPSKSPAGKSVGPKLKLPRQAKADKIAPSEEELVAKECVTPEDVMALQGATTGGCVII